MTRLPNSLSISLWGVGVCWVAVAIGYLTDSGALPIPSLLISLLVLMAVPLAAIGVLGGVPERPHGRQEH